MLERGRAEASDFAVHFASRCIHFPQLLSARRCGGSGRRSWFAGPSPARCPPGGTAPGLQDLLAGWQGSDPNVLTSLVLREAYQRRHGDDDRSALCVYLPAGKRGRREV